MVKLKRDVPLVVIVLGLGASTVGADLVASEHALAFALGGSLLTWGTLFAMAAFLDDEIWGRLLSDERTEQITYRSTSIAWLFMLSVTSTLMLSLGHYDGAFETESALLVVQAVGILTFAGAMSYNSRQI